MSAGETLFGLMLSWLAGLAVGLIGGLPIWGAIAFAYLIEFLFCALMVAGVELAERHGRSR